MYKRGFIGTVLAAPWFIILFFFMLIIFLFIFTILAPFVVEKHEIMGEILDNGFSFSVVNFFRMSSSKGNVQDLFYYYSKNLEGVYLDEIRNRMKEFLREDICVEILIEDKKIGGRYFNNCDSKKLVNRYEFIDFDKRKVKVNFYQFERGFFVKQLKDACVKLDESRCLNWVGCVLDNGGCKYG